MPSPDPLTILRIQRLELRARAVVEGFLQGLHRSPYHGFSAEFSEYRPYSPGDDLRYLDWRLLARTDRTLVKKFEDETNVRIHLLVDLSRSMGYGHERPDKAEYAKTLAASLAWFLLRQRDAVGLVTFAEQVLDIVPARARPGQLQRLMVALERAVVGTSTGLVPALDDVARVTRARGVVVLITDALTPMEGLERALAQLRARGHEVVFFRILDPAEVDFPFEGAARFEDLESGTTIHVDPQRTGDDYRRAFQAHEDELTTVCRDLGVDWVRTLTTRPFDELLFEFLQARARRGRSVLRAGGPR